MGKIKNKEKNHFIESLELINFKCFKKFSMSGINNINLISGKNNIGKTSLMEAIELFLSSSNIPDLADNTYNMLKRRQFLYRSEKYFELDFIHFGEKYTTIKINKKEIKIAYSDELEDFGRFNSFISTNDNFIEYEPFFEFTVNKEKRVLQFSRINSRMRFSRNEKLNASKKINFITSTTADENDIAIFYGSLIDFNEEGFLNESLSLFDPNIKSFKQKLTERGVVLKLSIENHSEPVLLSSLGEGINRYIAIICAIWASKDGYLFIDEIENGIHYTNYEKLWQLVFKASKMANCQIFVTTHSKECIEAFNKVNENNYGSFFEMYRNEKTKEILTKYRDNEQLDYSITHNGEFRGE